MGFVGYFFNTVSTQEVSNCKSVRPSARPSVRNTFVVHSLCNLELQKFSFLFFQTLHKYCSHIEDVHLLFCTNFMDIFSTLGKLNLDIFRPKMHGICFV